MFRRVERLYDITLQAVDGEAGSLDDFYFDDEEWITRYLVVDTGGWLGGRQVLISPTVVDFSHSLELGDLDVRLTREQIENSPDIDLHRPVSRQQLVELNDYYGWPAYWGGSAMMGTATIGVYPAVVAGARATEEAAEEEEDAAEVYQGDPHLRSTRVVSGYDIHATDGEIGHVEDFFVGEEDWCVRYMLVDTRDWLPGRKVLIASHWIERVSWPEIAVYVDLTKEQIKESPEYDPEEPIDRSYELELFNHYKVPAYWAH
jgi:hypothetical protein